MYSKWIDGLHLFGQICTSQIATEMGRTPYALHGATSQCTSEVQTYSGPILDLFSTTQPHFFQTSLAIVLNDTYKGVVRVPSSDGGVLYVLQRKCVSSVKGSITSVVKSGGSAHPHPHRTGMSPNRVRLEHSEYLIAQLAQGSR